MMPPNRLALLEALAPMNVLLKGDTPPKGLVEEPNPPMLPMLDRPLDIPIPPMPIDPILLPNDPMPCDIELPPKPDPIELPMPPLSPREPNMLEPPPDENPCPHESVGRLSSPQNKTLAAVTYARMATPLR